MGYQCTNEILWMRYDSPAKCYQCGINFLLSCCHPATAILLTCYHRTAINVLLPKYPYAINLLELLSALYPNAINMLSILYEYIIELLSICHRLNAAKMLSSCCGSMRCDPPAICYNMLPFDMLSIL